MNITDIKKNQSVRDVHEIAKELRPIIDNEVKKQCAELDKIVASIPRDINSIETNEISAKALALQIELFYLAERQTNAQLYSDIAITVEKNSFAQQYDEADGTQSARQTKALLLSQESQVAKLLYGTIARRLNARIDEGHRLVKTLENIVISNRAEAKIRNRGAQRDDDLYSDNNTDNY